MQRCIQCGVHIASKVQDQIVDAESSNALMSTEIQTILSDLNALKDWLKCVMCQVIMKTVFIKYL